ncbi:hypothetical protein ACQ4PT_063887 [Festuca glaucescens]
MLGIEATPPATAEFPCGAAPAAEKTDGTATRARPYHGDEVPLLGGLLDGINFHQRVRRIARRVAANLKPASSVLARKDDGGQLQPEIAALRRQAIEMLEEKWKRMEANEKVIPNSRSCDLWTDQPWGEQLAETVIPEMSAGGTLKQHYTSNLEDHGGWTGICKGWTRKDICSLKDDGHKSDENYTVFKKDIDRLSNSLEVTCSLTENLTVVCNYSVQDHVIVGKCKRNNIAELLMNFLERDRGPLNINDAGGGLWAQQQSNLQPLLITKVKNNSKSSETILNTVPLWVQVYDLPWNRQKKSTAQLIANRLGNFLEADLNAEGNIPYDFLRVRFEIPIDRGLRQSITTQVKATVETSTCLLRYERVPFFCFWCGFIGHTRLRCSPVWKFERRQSYAPSQSHPQAREELKISQSSGDNSYTLGVPADRRGNRNVVRHMGDHVLQRVDARDGFEDEEKEELSEVDAELAANTSHLNLPLAHTDIAGKKWGKKLATHMGRGKGGMQEGKMRQIVESVIPLAMYPAYPSASDPANLGSQEMIPPLRGLSSMVFSAGDTFMSDEDSIFGKRTAEQQEGDLEDRTRALVLYEESLVEGKLKKGRLEVAQTLEATSHGAAGQLTGSRAVTRQEQ